MALSLPDWLDTDAYPFTPQEFNLPAGTMRYVDEGSGEPIVMVHGNPYWSFLFRGLVRYFAGTRRCVAPDHIGFGLSDKPSEWDYLPEHHAENLNALLEALDLENVTVVVNDWGGPVGLSYAIEHPGRVRNVVVTNSWCWPVDDEWYYRLFSGFVGGPVGRWLVRKHNVFARTLVPRLYGDKRRLTPEIHRHITAHLADSGQREGCWIFARSIIGSTEWLRELWSRRSALAGKVRLLAWGMKDIAFREKELLHWSEAFPEAEVARFGDVGHFVAEEAPERLAGEMERVL
jgi:haloalkane dehalogenase